jgi:hypothetical protein
LMGELEQADLPPLAGAGERPVDVPNSSLSRRSSARAAQLIAMNGWSRRGLALCMLWANSSFPVPVSRR